jgi:hypothetical protein
MSRFRLALRAGLITAAALAAAVTLVTSAAALSINTAAITFPGVTLDGTDKLVAGSTSAWPADATGENGGWKVTVASTDFGIDEVQSVSVGAATAGTFTLTYSGQTTGSITWNASAADVATALKALSNIEDTDVTTSGAGLPGAPVVVTFVGLLGKQNVAQMTITPTGLTGGTAAVITTTQGRTIAVANFQVRLLGDNITWVSGDAINLPASTQTDFASLSGTPIKIASAAVGEGNGVYNMTPDFRLTVPAETYIGSYTATVAVTISAGP